MGFKNEPWPQKAAVLFNGGIETVNDCQRVKTDFFSRPAVQIG